MVIPRLRLLSLRLFNIIGIGLLWNQCLLQSSNNHNHVLFLFVNAAQSIQRNDTNIDGCSLTSWDFSCSTEVNNSAYMTLLNPSNQVTRADVAIYWGEMTYITTNMSLMPNKTYVFDHNYTQPGTYNLMYNITLYNNVTSNERCFTIWSPGVVKEYSALATRWPLTVTFTESDECSIGNTLSKAPTFAPSPRPQNPPTTSSSSSISHHIMMKTSTKTIVSNIIPTTIIIGIIVYSIL